MAIFAASQDGRQDARAETDRGDWLRKHSPGAAAHRGGEHDAGPHSDVMTHSPWVSASIPTLCLYLPSFLFA